MRLCSVVAIIGLVCLGGCGSGDTGPTRYRLTGNVTFNGKPVKNGAVQLNPKTGEFGGGGAAIEDGWYDTAGGGTRGHLGGLHTVRVTSDMGQEYDENWEPAFPPYEFEQDLPRSSSTLDIEVPARANRKKR